MWGDGACDVVPTEVRRVSCLNWMSDSVHKHEVPAMRIAHPPLPPGLWHWDLVEDCFAQHTSPPLTQSLFPIIIHFKQPVIACVHQGSQKKFGLRRIEKSVQHVAPLKSSGWDIFLMVSSYLENRCLLIGSILRSFPLGSIYPALYFPLQKSMVE